jgi:hypothetical protein
MPTFQSTPLLRWTFPDEAYNMNYRHREMAPPSIPFLDAVPGIESPFAAHERQVALDRVTNTSRAKKGMEGKLNTTERSQRYERPASLSAVPNGVFMGSPMEYVTSSGLRGGVITTKEGQEWLAKTLKQRAEEYGALASGSTKTFPKIEASTTPDVDALFTTIFSAFNAGSFTNSVAENMNKLLQALLRVGSTIDSQKVAEYARLVQQLIITIRGYRGETFGVAGDYSPSEERLRLIENLQNTLKLIESVIREIARTIYEPQSSREQVMSTLSSRLLTQQAAQYRPTFVGPESARGTQIQQAAQSNLQLGRREPPGPLIRPEVEPVVAAEGPNMWEQPEPVYNDDFEAEEIPEEIVEEAPQRGYLQDMEDQFGSLSGLGKKRRGRPRKHRK